MIINYKEEYIKAILSYISYADMDGSENSFNLINIDISPTFPNNSKFKINFLNFLTEYGNNPSGKIEYESMISSLDYFANNFKILKQEITRGLNGFSAVTYQLQNDIIGTSFKKGQIFVGYRGTESTQFGDLVTDFFLTFTSNFRWPISQEGQALEYLKEEILKLKDDEQLYICGHSLGGYLATRSFLYLNSKEPEDPKDVKNANEMKKVKGVSTFNGAGFSTFIGNPFLSQNTEYGSKVSNFFSYRGLEVTAGDIHEFLAFKGNFSLFQHLGKRIKTVTENPGGFSGNHSMALMTQSMGFYSVFQNLLVDVPELKDADGVVLTTEQQKIYAMERIMMGSVSEDNDSQLLYSTVAQRMINAFGLKVDNIVYPSPVSQLLSLQETELMNPNIKIKLIDGISFSPYGNDSNEKRAIMNALVNNLAYVAIVPESYNTGIFDKANSKNDLYNMTFYSQEYLEYRVMYNNIYSYVLENKLINKLPNTFTKEILNNNLFPKIAFIDQINTTPGGESKVIYVNTTEKEYNDDQTGNIKAIYFSSHLYNYFNIFKNNALVFDTPLNDSINIFGDNSILKPSNGINHVSIGKNSKNAIIEINKEVNQVDLYNESFDYPTTLNFLNKPIEDIVIIGAVYKEPPKQNSLKFKSIYTSSSCTGIVDLVMSNYSITHKEIINLISVFPEVFNTPNGSSLKFDQGFIDNYTEATRYKFKSVGMASYSQGSSITKEHADYVNNKVEEYKKSIGVL